ncbi:MCE family protein [Nocardioides speluncae]|uniref:MCE family protein n=1 Tax=Nocardioides speluncae TaxID=2670337 RepID=UPI000D6901B5|nr:MCE family protein [Nocardioides speluncae]
MKKLRALCVALAGAMLLTGCDFDVYKLPLPGGADTGENPMTIEVEFADVLDLVPQSTVKVADVSVGKVTDVSLDGYNAKVTIEVRNDVKLPDNAEAEIRQTSLLGEKFVSLRPPAEAAPRGELGNGDVIPLERSGRNPEVEEVLGALSLLLNGGGVAQLKTITSELNKALDGREGSARSVLTQLRTLMRQLDDNKGDIVTAITKLNRLAVSVNKQRNTIDAALEELPSALRSLDSQRNDLVKMLKALNRLSTVGVRVIKASKENTVESLRLLAPVLGSLADSGSDLPYSLQSLLTFPFIDAAVGENPQVARNLHMGDYTNLSVQLDLGLPGASGPGLPTLPTNLPSVVNPTVIVNNVVKCLQSGNPTSTACQKALGSVTGVLKLREECQKPANKDKDICKQLNAIPGLPALPGLPGLPGLKAGAQRAAPGQPGAADPRGPTMGQLMENYDPDLVALLVPAVVVE